MRKITTLAVASALAFGFTGIGMAQTVTGDDQGVEIIIRGESWDADSRGFAYVAGLSKKEGKETSARRGSRISVDGQPDKFAISGPGPGFELTFTTTESSFRLIVDGDRFPRTITQPVDVPDGGGVLDIGRVGAPRAEGPEHTWPLGMAATALGYTTALEMLADNKAAIRLLVLGSGAAGAPDLANDATISITSGDTTDVFPFTMDPQDTFFQMTGPRLGAFLIIVSFAAGDDPDKNVTIRTTDTVTAKMLDPPRPWTYDPLVVSVRKGFATEVDVIPKTN
jgi:hypothetical protein